MSIESVVSWANRLKKNLWWRHAIRLVAEKGSLDRNDLQLLFSVAKMEHALEPPPTGFIWLSVALTIGISCI